MEGNIVANSAESAYYLNPESPHYVGAYYEGFWLATLKTQEYKRWLLEAGFVNPVRINDTTITARKA